jgi:carboxymethylenebutenolidase
METAITFTRTDGKEAKGYLGNTAYSYAPGIVVIQEW